jgi:hypothetical protein
MLVQEVPEKPVDSIKLTKSLFKVRNATIKDFSVVL